MMERYLNTFFQRSEERSELKFFCTILFLFCYLLCLYCYVAPSFANLFLCYFEINALNNAPYKLHMWLSYIDDIFVIWTDGLDRLRYSLIMLTAFTPPSNLPHFSSTISFAVIGERKMQSLFLLAEYSNHTHLFNLIFQDYIQH